VNNVETLAYLPYILQNGQEWFAKGRPRALAGFQGRIDFGSREETGEYEVPLGVTIRQLIDDCAGGLRDGRTFLGVQPAAARRHVCSRNISI